MRVLYVMCICDESIVQCWGQYRAQDREELESMLNIPYTLDWSILCETTSPYGSVGGIEEPL